MRDFWHRWHISLSTWFRDYVFIPLGGARGGEIRLVCSILAVFLLSGLWHGANWTFVVWGFYHSLAYLISTRLETTLGQLKILLGGWVSSVLATMTTLFIVMLGWVLFRAQSLEDALQFYKLMFTWSDWAEFTIYDLPFKSGTMLCVTIALFTVEAINRNKAHVLVIGDWPSLSRWIIYIGLLFSLNLFGAVNNSPFIYFQF